MAVNIGPKIGIDGEAEYRKQINNIIQSTKTLKSEYQSLESTVNKSKNPFKNFAAELDNNKKKHDILSEALTKNREKLETLQQMAAQASEKFGENATQTLKWKQAVADAEAECGRLEAELKQIPSSLESVGSAMQSVGSKMTSVGKDLSMKVTAPLVGIGTIAAKNFAEVDKTMQLTNATMGNTEEQAKALSKAMKDAASNSTFGMSDAATATLNFARAGLDAAQAAAALAPAMNLAAGEGGDLATVSAGLVGTINGFGASFEETGHYADVFAAACNNSALDVNSLANSMGVAAPVFKTAGSSIEDAAIALGIMANNNIDADKASNALKTGLMRLADEQGAVTKSMEEYGIAASDIWGENGQLKSITEVQKNLHDSFADLNEQQQLAAASAIFGKNQGAAWLALINAAPSDVDKLAKSIENCDGVTQDMADAMMSGFGGSMEKLKSSIDVASASFGEALAPSIEKIAGGIQKAVDWFNSLSDSQQEMVAKVGILVAAIGPLLVVGGTLISSIGTIVGAIGTIGPALTLLTGPFGLVVAGIAAAVEIGVILYKNWDTISAKAAELGESISQKWDAIKTKTVETWDAAKNKVGEAADFMKDIAGRRISEIRNAYEENGGGIRGAAAATWEVLTTQFKVGFDVLDKLTNGKLTEIKDAFFGRFNELKDSALNWGRDIISGLVDGIRNGINDVKNAANEVAQSIRDRLHFSEPDVGPLKDFHTYMPDMMNGLAKGMISNLGAVESAANLVAGAISTPMQSTSVSNSYGGFNIVVNAADGQSASDIADEIEARIAEKISRQESVWA